MSVPRILYPTRHVSVRHVLILKCWNYAILWEVESYVYICDYICHIIPLLLTSFPFGTLYWCGLLPNNTLVFLIALNGYGAVFPSWFIFNFVLPFTRTPTLHWKQVTLRFTEMYLRRIFFWTNYTSFTQHISLSHFGAIKSIGFTLYQMLFSGNLVHYFTLVLFSSMVHLVGMLLYPFEWFAFFLWYFLSCWLTSIFWCFRYFWFTLTETVLSEAVVHFLFMVLSTVVVHSDWVALSDLLVLSFFVDHSFTLVLLVELIHSASLMLSTSPGSLDHDGAFNACGSLHVVGTIWFHGSL